MNYIKPKIIISKCLEFDACRYDGQMINNNYIKKLKEFIDFETVCPEVEIGMGIPRAPIHILNNGSKNLLYQKETGLDFSSKMISFSNKYLAKIKYIDGFILKANSPSCGIKNTKLYSKNTPSPIGKGSGFFASRVIENFPNHPKEDEKRLNNVFLREHFFTSIFTLADFRNVKSIRDLYDYHAKHKYLFMSYNQILMRKMGKIAANEKNEKIISLLDNYYDLLLLLLSKKPRHVSNINTHMHIMGYFKNQISGKEKTFFLKTLEDYRIKKIPLSTVNSLLHSWTLRFENNYLLKQSFFNPFPSELIEKEKSRFE